MNSSRSIKDISKQIRKGLLTIAFKGQTSHISSGLSIADILSVLYFSELNISRALLSNPSRDRFILGKGHAANVLYVTLYLKKIISKKMLDSFEKNGSLLGMHPESELPGIEHSTGSLGHGLPYSVGQAMAGKLLNRNYRVICLISDAEIQEGSNWEALLFARQHNLNNLVLMIDNNKLQAYGKTENTLNIEPLKEKFDSFGWTAMEIDGHNISQIQSTLRLSKKSKKPTAIICKTIAGKGVSFMEGKLLWHYKSLQEDEFKQAISEIEQ